MNDSTLRKPRLTEGVLEDLPVAVEVLRDEIVYLQQAIETHHNTPSLVDRFKARKESLARAEAWLTRFIDATRGQRAAGDDEQPPFALAG